MSMEAFIFPSLPAVDVSKSFIRFYRFVVGDARICIFICGVSISQISPLISPGLIRFFISS